MVSLITKKALTITQLTAHTALQIQVHKVHKIYDEVCPLERNPFSP